MTITHSRRVQEVSNRIAPPSHRHAAPSAPWPWVDIQDDGECPIINCRLLFSSQNLCQEVDRRQLESSEPPVPSQCDHRACNNCWKEYPQSLFPNWAPPQVKKSKISMAINDYPRNVDCIIHHVDVDDNGYFRDAGKHFAKESTIKDSWDKILRSRVSTILIKMDNKMPFWFCTFPSIWATAYYSIDNRSLITFECERSLLRIYLVQSYKCWAQSKSCHFKLHRLFHNFITRNLFNLTHCALDTTLNHSSFHLL